MTKRQKRAARQRATTVREPRRIIGAAQTAYHDAATGLTALTAGAPFGGDTSESLRMIRGVRSLVVSGRMVVLVLRRLQRVPEFAGWMAPIEREINSDPLLSFFVRLRNEIEKEGLPDLYATIDLLRDGKVVGEALVRMTEGLHGIWTSGHVKGSEDPERARLAQTADKAWVRLLHIENPPTEHLGQPVRTDRLDLLGGLYLNYLGQRVIGPARQKLGTPDFQ